MLLFTLQCYYRVRQMLQKRMMVRKKREHKGNNDEIQNTRSLKSVRLIMTPLIGIMLSNCDVSVRMSCLNTWCYLLPRLDTSLNDSSMINRVVGPMFEAAFQLDPNGSDFGKDKSLKFLQLWIYRRPGGVLDICVYMFELYSYRSYTPKESVFRLRGHYSEWCMLPPFVVVVMCIVGSVIIVIHVPQEHTYGLLRPNQPL